MTQPSAAASALLRESSPCPVRATSRFHPRQPRLPLRRSDPEAVHLRWGRPVTTAQVEQAARRDTLASPLPDRLRRERFSPLAHLGPRTYEPRTPSGAVPAAAGSQWPRPQGLRRPLPTLRGRAAASSTKVSSRRASARSVLGSARAGTEAQPATGRGMPRAHLHPFLAHAREDRPGREGASEALAISLSPQWRSQVPVWLEKPLSSV
jgi:hypothetical protein